MRTVGGSAPAQNRDRCGAIAIAERVAIYLPWTRGGSLATFLLLLTASLSAWSQAKPTGNISGVWMPNVNYTTFWEPYNGPWTPEKFAQYDQNVPRPRMAKAAAEQGRPRAAAIPMTPWSAAAYEYNGTPDGAGEGRRNEVDSYSHCSPPAVPRNWAIRRPYEIIQEDNCVLVLFEGDHWIRQIWTDGRTHSPTAGHTWGGDSIGKWEGDTLVVDTIGFNDKAWIDIAGHPHSEAMHIVERIRRADRNHLIMTFTFDDPKAFSKPWSGMLMADFHPDWVIGEVIPCEDVILGHPIPKISGMPVILRPKN